MPGAVSFNASSNELVFSKPWKKIGAVPSCRFREKRKNLFKKWRHRADG